MIQEMINLVWGTHILQNWLLRTV